MTPNLKIYNLVFEKLQGFGFEVISSKDINQELPYPFFVVKYPSSNRENFTFDSYSGLTILVIDIWSLANDVGKHDKLIQKVVEVMTPHIITDEYQFEEHDVNITTIEDNTTKQLLLHTVITIQYKTY
ncbi:hypothetical protein ACWEWU_09480 [Staphylococcus xylosus]